MTTHEGEPAGGVQRRILTLLSLRPGETARALLTCFYLFLIIAAYLMIKAVRNALFISEFGAMKLPWVMLGIALLAGVFVAGYLRIARSVDPRRLVVGSLLFFASNVVVFWWLAIDGRSWLYPVIYIWAGVFGVVGPTQVWTLANDLFTTREAKRVFGLVGAGGILGAIVGGWATGKLAPRIGTVNLLLVVAGLLVAGAVIVAGLSRLRTAQRTVSAELPRPHGLAESLRLVSHSGHLRLLAALVFVSALATTSVDFQFSVVAERSIGDRDKLAAFFGMVYGTVSLVAFALQLALTSRILGQLGVGFAILLLPLSLLSGTLALVLGGSLWAAVLLKGSDGAFKHSIDRSCRELMYLPVPASIKVHAKSTIDTVFDRLGDGSAGVLQLLLTAGFGLGLRGSLVFNAVILSAWIALALRLKQQYVEQLRRTLGDARDHIVNLLPRIDEADARATVERELAADEEARRLVAFDWARSLGIELDRETVQRVALEDPSPAVRRLALACLLGCEAELPPELARLIDSRGHEALVEAIDVVVADDADATRRRLDALTAGADDDGRLSLVALTLRRLGPEFDGFAERVFGGLLEPTVPAAARREAARALALLPAESSVARRLPGLLHDRDPLVAAAAVEAVARSGRADLVPRLVALLAHPDLRAPARRAIESFGAGAEPALVEALTDSGLAPEVRRRVPVVLASVASGAGTAALAAVLGEPDAELRRHCVRALRRIRQRRPAFGSATMHAIQRELLRRLDRWAELDRHERRLRAAAEDAGTAAEALGWLLEAVAQVRARAEHETFRMLELLHAAEDVARARAGLASDDPTRRANAVELLDNLASHAVAARMLPLLEHRLDRAGRREIAGPLEATVAGLLADRNAWLAACAVHAAGALGLGRNLADAVRAARNRAEPAVREEAAAFLAALPSGSTP